MGEVSKKGKEVDKCDLLPVGRDSFVDINIVAMGGTKLSCGSSNLNIELVPIPCQFHQLRLSPSALSMVTIHN